MLLNDLRIPVTVDKRGSTVRIKGSRAEETRQEIYQILDRHRATPENPQQIKATRGTKAYLMSIGCMQGVRWPQHWKKEKYEGNPAPSWEQLSQHSSLFQQIVQLVNGTWDRTQVGIGFDGAGLSHSKMIVKRIFACKNISLYQQYDLMRKNMCKDASVNPYTAVRGLKGEQEIATRVHITGNNSPHKIPPNLR